MRIFFQNPTKGPLITVSFGDDNGASLAFVPAAMDCAAKTGAVTTGGAMSAPVVTIAAIVGGLVPGDSSPHHLQGINRFATLASITATPDGVPATSDASPAGPAAVGLPGDATPTTAVEVNPLDGLADILKTWDGLSPLEISGFKFEKVADTDGKPTIKITISTDNVQDIIAASHGIKDAFPKDTTTIKTDFTHPDLRPNILKWSHHYFSDALEGIKAKRDHILEMSRKLERGEALSEADQALLIELNEVIIPDVSSRREAFNKDYDLIGFLANRPRGDSGAQMWKGLTHDIYRRIVALCNFTRIIHKLIGGKPLTANDIETLDRISNASFSLEYFIRSAASLSADDLNQNDVKLTIEPGASDFTLVSAKNYETLIDILANLISNAARYSNPQRMGEVHITVRRTDDGIEIEVRDNGIGIPAEKLTEIGQFGFRVGEKPVDGSHGRGLWEANQNLNWLGWGPLRVESTHGEGSRFRFTIPGRDVLH